MLMPGPRQGKPGWQPVPGPTCNVILLGRSFVARARHMRTALHLPQGVLSLFLIFAAPGASALSPVEVPVASDLHADAEIAERDHLPLLLVFSAHSCAYCRTLEEEVLKPNLRSGNFDDRVLLRKVMMEPGRAVRDLTGARTDTAELAAHYGIKVTPTVVLIDAWGRELAPRIVGVSTLDFYGSYLDEAIDTARTELSRSASPKAAAAGAAATR